MTSAEDTTDDGFYSTVADLLRDCRQTFLDVVEEHQWVPSPQSQASADKLSADALDANEPSAEHLTGFNLVAEVAITNLELASLHVEGMAALYDARWLFITPDVVARSVVEALGHAVWVVGTRETTARQRLARAYLLHAASAIRDKELDKLRNEETSGLGARRRLEAFKRCRAVFRDARTRDLEAGQLDGEQLPGLTRMVELFFDAALKNDALVAEKRHTDAIYGYLSTAAHPTLFRLRDLRRASRESNALSIEMGPQQARQPALLVTMLFYLVLRTFVNYYGYPSAPDSQLADHIDIVFPGAML